MFNFYIRISLCFKKTSKRLLKSFYCIVWFMQLENVLLYVYYRGLNQYM